MNRKQIICLWIGIIIFACVSLMMPLYQYGNLTCMVWLLVRWVVIGVVTTGLIYTFKNKKDKKPKADQKQ
jgi:amino acid transporter